MSSTPTSLRPKRDAAHRVKALGTTVAFPGSTPSWGEGNVPNPKDKHPLKPALDHTESKLKAALDEVCDETDSKKRNTGELIRVEGSLAIASDAAKRAVSLRK